jgi:hypothetical protein
MAKRKFIDDSSLIIMTRLVEGCYLATSNPQFCMIEETKNVA